MIENKWSNRPNIHSLRIDESMSAEELFQNQTLRPIIKMQHKLLIAHFKNYIVSRKCDFGDFNDEKRKQFIENAFQKDVQFRSELRGMVIGQFSIAEYSEYTKFSSPVGKRIIQIIKERILTNINEVLLVLD